MLQILFLEFCRKCFKERARSRFFFRMVKTSEEIPMNVNDLTATMEELIERFLLWRNHSISELLFGRFASGRFWFPIILNGNELERKSSYVSLT